MSRILCDPAEIASFAREPGAAMVDVRDRAAFESGHVEGSGHIPLRELGHRLHELPFRRATPILLLVGEDPAEGALRLLETEGYALVRAARLEDAARSGLSLETGRRAARLWQPTRLVEEHLALLRTTLPPGPVLDLACGNGRNAVFLAMAGIEVVACDVLESALDRTRALADAHGARVGTWLVDLEDESSPPPLPHEAYAAILVLSYLHRPLVPAIRDAIRPGGLVLYETFTVDQARLFGKPRRARFLLKPLELLDMFRGFEVILSREGVEEPGRAVASLVARKKA